MRVASQEPAGDHEEIHLEGGFLYSSPLVKTQPLPSLPRYNEQLLTIDIPPSPANARGDPKRHTSVFNISVKKKNFESSIYNRPVALLAKGGSGLRESCKQRISLGNSFGGRCHREKVSLARFRFCLIFAKYTLHFSNYFVRDCKEDIAASLLGEFFLKWVPSKSLSPLARHRGRGNKMGADLFR